MRRLLARMVIRRAWRLGRDWPVLQREIPDGKTRLIVLLNVLSLITTALGGHAGWMPQDVRDDFKLRLASVGTVGG